MSKFKIALLCGGPSLERAVSLNSARTVCDHLASAEIEILPIYFDHKKNSFLVSRSQLYSNTPADFDFKLSQTAHPLTPAKLISLLKRADLIFPVMHGQFGEDGQIQKFLEKNRLPFMGSAAAACELAFDKYRAHEFLKEKDFYVLPSLLLSKNRSNENRSNIKVFFKKYKLNRAIIKPTSGGSSLAVFTADNAREAWQRAQTIFKENIDSRAIIEPFCQGREFTVIILENKEREPVALLPTEIELASKNGEIFDYRKKYLATNQVSYHCPPRFSDQVIFKIQEQAQKIFHLFKMSDFARFDGWILPGGQIWFSDFNPISGLEQNSFLFIQSSRLGLSHEDFLRFIVKNACRRYNIKFPNNPPDPLSARTTVQSGGYQGGNKANLRQGQRKVVNVIFGGQTSERQVSVMSGTNVWLKLKQSAKYDPQPFLLDLKNRVWRLPYGLTLYHTVEEIAANCQIARQNQKRLKKLTAKIISSLKLEKKELSAPWFLPEKMTLKEFIKKSPYVFIGLHGGAGENGVLQKMLERAERPFNGSGSTISRLCMNKFATSQALTALKGQGVHTARKKIVEFALLKKIISRETALKQYWQSLRQELGSSTIIIKPVDDGCSAGIARLYSAKDLKTYLEYVLLPLDKGGRGGLKDVSRRIGKREDYSIPQGSLTNQHGIIEMPARPMQKIMFEEFVETDKIQVVGNKLNWRKKTGWIEITCGLLEVNGKMRAFNPSLTVASGNVLTLEEKFQGGTGINITPPPAPFVSAAAAAKAKIQAEKIAKILGISGYGRIDAFMNIKNGELIVIEANTLPALSPATVIYHQALSETPPLYPREFLEKIVGKNY